jgi:acetyl-CoA C-acetyltransferase
MIAANARANAARNEYAHLQEPMTVEDVMQSPMLWDPIRYLETCPSSDGAVALGVASEEVAKKGRASPAWVKAGASYARRCGCRARPGESRPPGRACAKHVYAQAGITDPWNQIDAARSTCRSRGSRRCGSRTSGFCRDRRGWKIVDRGEQKSARTLPINPSGGVLCTNPIGASGMLRLGEAALQVMGRAGAHQVEGRQDRPRPRLRRRRAVFCDVGGSAANFNISRRDR